jgi:hypothetical protein
MNIIRLTNANGSTLPIGTPVYSSAAGSVNKAKADAAGTSVLIGLVADPDGILTAVKGPVMTSGLLRAATGQWDTITGGSGGLTFNATYYIDAATAGKLTTTAPATFATPVGVAVSTTEMSVGATGPRLDDGSEIATVADSNATGGVPVVHVFTIADASTANYDITLADKTEIYDVVVLKTGGTGVAVTATVQNGSTAITDAMSLNVAIKLMVRPLQIDTASNVINAAGTLRVAIARTTGNAACRIFVYGVKRA